MIATLDVDAVRAFVLVAELRSFTRAAEASDATQSAVSLRVRRLEEALGRRLLERTPRLVGLSADGAAFLEPARALLAAHDRAAAAVAPTERRLVVGLSDHIVGAELPRVLRRLGEADPGLVIDLRVGLSTDLLAAYDAGALDAAVLLRHDRKRRGGERVLAEQFAWMASPRYAHAGVLRLAASADSCGVRAMAVARLRRAGIDWTESFVGGGVATVGAAVEAGLAVAALARRVAPPGLVDVGERFGLPPLPAVDMVLYAGAADPRTRAALRALAAAIRATSA